MKKQIRRSEITDTLEELLTEVFERTHKCPWYKRHYRPTFSYIKEITGIGDGITVKCNNCGKEFDVTNYKLW